MENSEIANKVRRTIAGLLSFPYIPLGGLFNGLFLFILNDNSY